ncbi:hypothetical protein R1sor_023888 [Riccia sorocarpa]|uniref:GTD-binding domain-containing protein n=1 Tax=Riccia sorocarpa TaxID=122646 RepID=A0ABD3GRY4_9MARC
MAWTYAENHVPSDRWKVSSLIWAFVELILGYIVLLCATLSIAVTKVIKSLGMSLSWPTGEVDKGGEAMASPKHFGLASNSQSKPRELTASTLGRQLSTDGNVSFICGECTQHLSDCSCSSGDQAGNPPRCYVVKASSLGRRQLLDFPSSSSIGYQSCSSSLLQEEDVDFQRLDSFSSDIIDELSGDEHTNNSFVGASWRYRNLDAAMSGRLPPSLFGRPLKRKFAKVFPGDGSPRSHAQWIVDSSTRIAKKSPVVGMRGQYKEGEIVEDDQDAQPLSLTRKQVVVANAGNAEFVRKASRELSSGKSSDGSFAYVRRMSVNSGRGEGVSFDTQFGKASGGDLPPKWNGSSSYEVSHSLDVMEKESSVANEDDDDDFLDFWGAEELREALRAERNALAALYCELEEERNASTIAANEAMAMITRLQEEKAAAQMECRQYQRMAEEKQLYDQEAIALLQDILVRRDQEVFNLEEEAKLYRQQLLELSTDELDQADEDPSEDPQKNSDFLLIERETLLLEADEEWRSKKDSREERLLAEIREWVTSANQKAAQVPAKEEAEGAEISEPSRISGNVSGGDPGRKNLLGSFSSAVEHEEHEETRRNDGDSTEAGPESEAVSEDTEARNQTPAADYESFHTMMDSLRNEPELRDETSLETLDKIEEKFEKQSGTGTVKNEDDLRRIWKKTLRSLDTPASRSPDKQEEKGHAEDTDDSGLKSGIVQDAEANRAMEQKRISVLEYVSKFEKQLHKGGAKKPTQQLGRGTSSDSSKVEKSALLTSESGLDDQSASNGALAESGSEKIKSRSSQSSRLPSSRFSRPASDSDRLQVKGELSPSVRSATESLEDRSERPLHHAEEDEVSEGSRVYDVYEVRGDTMETSTQNRSGSAQSGEARTSSKLVPGESLYSPDHDSDVYLEFLGDDGDRLGKPEPPLGYHSPKADGSRRPFSESGAGRYARSLVEEETSLQDFEWLATSVSGRAARSGANKDELGSTLVSPSVQGGHMMDQLTVRLKALEADRQAMQETISSLKAENDEKQLLLEIAHQLREFRGMEQKATNSVESQELPLVSAIKGILPFSRLGCSLQAYLNKLARVFIRSLDLGVCHGDQHAGLCRLLQISPQRPRRKGVQAEEIICNGPQDAPLHQAAKHSSLLVTPETWPMDVRDRSGTALSGWDY